MYVYVHGLICKYTFNFTIKYYIMVASQLHTYVAIEFTTFIGMQLNLLKCVGHNMIHSKTCSYISIVKTKLNNKICEGKCLASHSTISAIQLHNQGNYPVTLLVKYFLSSCLTGKSAYNCFISNHTYIIAMLLLSVLQSGYGY